MGYSKEFIWDKGHNTPFPSTLQTTGNLCWDTFSNYISKSIFTLRRKCLFKYLILPGGIAYFFGNVELDGKSPHKFIYRFFAFTFERKKLSRYKDTTGNIGSYQYKTVVRFKDDSIKKK